MTEGTEAKATEVKLLCLSCGDILEIADPHALLLAAHLDNHCTGTADILHP